MSDRCSYNWHILVASSMKSQQYVELYGNLHDDVIKWKHFLRHWPFVRGIHRLPVNSPHKGKWRGALMFSLTSVWSNVWVSNREAGDLRRHRDNYDVTVMMFQIALSKFNSSCIEFPNVISSRWIHNGAVLHIRGFVVVWRITPPKWLRNKCQGRLQLK